MELNSGQINVTSKLLKYDKEKGMKKKYEKEKQRSKVYDRYIIDLAKMSLKIHCPGEVGDNKQIHIIEKINLRITVANCLAPLHKLFPTLSVDITFPTQIRFDFDFIRLKLLMRIKDQLLIQLEQKTFNVLEAKLRKFIEDEVIQKRKQQQLQDALGNSVS